MLNLGPAKAVIGYSGISSLWLLGIYSPRNRGVLLPNLFIVFLELKNTVFDVPVLRIFGGVLILDLINSGILIPWNVIKSLKAEDEVGDIIIEIWEFTSTFLIIS